MGTLESKSRFPGGQQRKWLHLDAKGSLTCVAADKHTLVTTLGIPLRDLRILDPLVCPSVWALLLSRCAYYGRRRCEVVQRMDQSKALH